MVIEPVTTYEEAPTVTEAARAELLASLERGEDDRKAGRVKRMSVAVLRSHAQYLFDDRLPGHRLTTKSVHCATRAVRRCRFHLDQASHGALQLIFGP
jgi:hypothetical protein